MLPEREADRDPEKARAGIKAFASQLPRDPDLGQDGRMMVPLFHDVERRMTKVLAFLGWAVRPVSVRYVRPPKVRVLDAAGRELSPKEVTIEFAALAEQLAYPVTAEVYVSRILDRGEFQRLCDRYRSRTAILEALR